MFYVLVVDIMRKYNARLITNSSEYEKFKQHVLCDLADDEVYFLSLSARNKYLTEEERVEFSLGRTEMFGRTIAKSKEDYDYAMDKLGWSLQYKTTKNGREIPAKALVVYANINPSSSLKAYLMFQKEMSNMVEETLIAQMNDKKPTLDGFKYAERKLMNCFQKATGNRYWVDIDFDIDKTRTFILTAVTDHLIAKHIVIETKSGYHLLIQRESLQFTAKSMAIPLHKLVEQANIDAAYFGGEVVFNKNAMIPVPGTRQSYFEVKIVDIVKEKP